MKNLAKSTKLFLILFLAVCVQKTNLFSIPTLQERCAEHIAQNIDRDEFIEGLISGKADTLKFLENICEVPTVRQVFVSSLSADLFVLKKVFAGHGSMGCAAKWSPDGKYLTGGSDGGAASVWNVETGEYKTLARHDETVLCAAWSPDSKYLASGLCDGIVRVWNVEAREYSDIVEGDKDFCSIAWSPDGKYLAGMTYFGTVIVGNIATLERKIFAGNAEILAGNAAWDLGCNVAWSPDSKSFTSSLGGDLIIFDVETGKYRDLDGYSIGKYKVAWSPDGKYLAGGLDSKSGGISCVWNVVTGEQKKLYGRMRPVYSVAWNPDGKSFISALDDGSILIWDIKTGEYKTLYTGEFENLVGMTYGVPVYSVSWSPDGKYLASGSSNGKIKIWRKITDLNQVLLILILRYLKKNDRMNEFYDIANLPHLNKEGETIQLISAWFDFNPIEQRYLKQEFGIDGIPT